MPLFAKPGAPPPAAGHDLFLPAGAYAGRRPSRILVLEHGRNPSTDYYLAPRLAAQPDLPWERIDIGAAAPGAAAIPEGSFVVIVRYLTPAWARHLLRLQGRLSGAAYFMDDDLPAARGSSELPLRYRYKIHRLFHAQRRSLARLCDRIWVSTPYLAEKYAAAAPVVVAPLPLSAAPEGDRPLVYFYHGTAAHRAEIEWLRGIVARVQQRVPRLVFMAVGDDGVRRAFAGIPRVLILHPMSWAGYREALPALRHDIGLAPLLEKPFNQGRAHTKFFDISRLGAAGLYSNVPPYADFVRHGADGLLLDNAPETWENAIVALANDPGLRERLLQAAGGRVAQLRARPDALPLP